MRYNVDNAITNCNGKHGRRFPEEDYKFPVVRIELGVLGDSIVG